MTEFGILTNDIEATGLYAFIEEIYACIESEPYSFIGDSQLGQANGKRLIGTRLMSADSAIDALKQDIDKNTIGSTKYAYTIDAKFAKGSIKDILLIDVTVFDPDTKQQLSYTHQIN
jgi:hypothetical protein